MVQPVWYDMKGVIYVYGRDYKIMGSCGDSSSAEHSSVARRARARACESSCESAEHRSMVRARALRVALSRIHLTIYVPYNLGVLYGVIYTCAS